MKSNAAAAETAATKAADRRPETATATTGITSTSATLDADIDPSSGMHATATATGASAPASSQRLVRTDSVMGPGIPDPVRAEKGLHAFPTRRPPIYAKTS